MHFGVLLPNKLKKRYLIYMFFDNVVLFIHIECYKIVLVFCYQKAKKIIIMYVSVNTVSFPHIAYFACNSAFSYLTILNTYVFANVIISFFFFHHKEFVNRVSAFWYLRNSKTLKRHAFDNVLFSNTVFSMSLKFFFFCQIQ